MAALTRMAAGLFAAGLVVTALAAGCGAGETPPEPKATKAERTRASDEVATSSDPAAVPVRCPDAAPGCEEAGGTILYVERVDPDGDGDAHFVVASSASITAPGISVIDVEADLRPRPLPRPGDALAAAGPVYEGSYGQRQIQAIEINFERAR